MSLVKLDGDRSKVIAIDNKTGPRPRKVLEEDEYLNRMARIIKRDFFLDLDSSTTGSHAQIRSNSRPSELSSRTCTDTPGTDRTDFSGTSSVKSMRDLRSMKLNEYLEKYTSEDNAYFDKLQRKDLKRHRAKYPWLYVKKISCNKGQAHITNATERLAIAGTSKEKGNKSNDWLFNKNSLFYPIEQSRPQQTQSTVNYESNKYMQEPIFKEPLPMRGVYEKSRGINRFTDKIGIDGKLLNGSETPSMNGYSFVAGPDTPIFSDSQPVAKIETNRFYLPSESPRDDLAHRLYEEKIAKKIRTPRTSTRSDSTKTPKSRLDKIF